MIKGLLATVTDPLPILSDQLKFYNVVGIFVILQCIVAMFGSSTILLCMWSPENVTSDFDKLTRIMYLYDPRACGRNLHKVGLITSVILDNDTRGADVLPVRWKQPEVTSSTRLSTKTRKYILVSVGFHAIWLVTAISLMICRYLIANLLHIHRIILAVCFYYTIFMILFDLSMGLVYIAHIQQSLTKGMVLRYSGWGVDIKLNSYNEFAGWLPIMASVCWTRGIIILLINIYFCKVLSYYRTKLKWREVKIKLKARGNLAFPDTKMRRLTIDDVEEGILYYRAGEYVPASLHIR